MTATDAAFAAVWSELGGDERRVLLEIAKRLAMGQRTYGRLDIDRERRDMQREASEELFDGCVYLACLSLMKKA